MPCFPIVSNCKLVCARRTGLLGAKLRALCHAGGDFGAVIGFCYFYSGWNAVF